MALAGRDHAVEVRVGRVDCRSGRMARPPPQVRRERSLAKLRGRCRSSAARCRRARPSWPFPPDPTGPSLTGGHSALTMSAASGRTLEPRAPSHGPASSRTMRPVTTPRPASARPVRWLIGLGLAFGTAMRCVAAEQSVQLSSPVPYVVFQRSALASHGRSRTRSSLHRARRASAASAGEIARRRAVPESSSRRCPARPASILRAAGSPAGAGRRCPGWSRGRPARSRS